MAHQNKLLKTSIVFAILCLALPNLALGRYYETNYEEHDGQSVEQPRSESTENNDEDSGLPLWAWALIIWVVLGWLADSDQDSQSTESQPRRTTGTSSSCNPYVIDPSR